MNNLALSPRPHRSRARILTGTAFNPDPESAEFFNTMNARGFTFRLSEEKTGKNLAKIHKNGTATEFYVFYVVFFKPGAVKLADDLPHGFIDPVRRLIMHWFVARAPRVVREVEGPSQSPSAIVQ
jgi:hypothetical protein